MQQVKLAQLTSQVQSLVFPHITPIFGIKGGVPHSVGTATLFSCDERSFLVTAAHVAAKLNYGYRLGVFSAQGEPPEILLDDWWMPVGAPMGPGKWREDVAILEVTKLYVEAKSPLPLTALIEPIALTETQGIFLSGYAKNPCLRSDGSDLEVLQRREVKAQQLFVKPLTSPAPFLPNITGLRDFEFPVHFSADDNKNLDSADLGFVFSAKGFSGSAVWRVSNSPPSSPSIGVQDLEVIGVATRWCKETSAVLVTRSRVILDVLKARIEA